MNGWFRPHLGHSSPKLEILKAAIFSLLGNSSNAPHICRSGRHFDFPKAVGLVSVSPASKWGGMRSGGF